MFLPWRSLAVKQNKTTKPLRKEEHYEELVSIEILFNLNTYKRKHIEEHKRPNVTKT